MDKNNIENISNKRQRQITGESVIIFNLYTFKKLKQSCMIVGNYKYGSFNFQYIYDNNECCAIRCSPNN